MTAVTTDTPRDRIIAAAVLPLAEGGREAVIRNRRDLLWSSDGQAARCGGPGRGG
jgi:hypothetical protein